MISFSRMRSFAFLLTLGWVLGTAGVASAGNQTYYGPNATMDSGGYVSGMGHSTTQTNYMYQNNPEHKSWIAEFRVSNGDKTYDLGSFGGTAHDHPSARTYPACFNRHSVRAHDVVCSSAWGEQGSAALFEGDGDRCLNTSLAAVDVTGQPGQVADAGAAAAPNGIDPSHYTTVADPTESLGSTVNPVAMIEATYTPDTTSCVAFLLSRASTPAVEGPAIAGQSVRAMLLSDGTTCMLIRRGASRTAGCGRMAGAAPWTYALQYRAGGKSTVYGFAPTGAETAAGKLGARAAGPVWVAETTSRSKASALFNRGIVKVAASR